MLKKVLICSDLSDASNLLITCVGDLKNIGVEEAVLVHVVYESIPLGFHDEFIGETKPISTETYPPLQEALNTLEKQRTVLENRGIKTNLEVVHGIPSRAINELAETHQVSAIVMGSHGKGIMKRATIGSVASEVISLTKIPVFLIKAELEETYEVVLSCRSLLNRILYLTDFSETAAKSLDYAEKIVADTKVPVTVLHVQDFLTIDDYIHNVPDLDPRLFEEAQAKNLEIIRSDLEAIKNRLEKAGSTQVDFQYPKGRPIDMVMETIKSKKDLSLIVMGSQGKGFVKELFVGSLSLQVTRYSPVPVLLIPAR